MLNKKLALNAGLSIASGRCSMSLLYMAIILMSMTNSFERVRMNTAQFGMLYNHAFFESDGNTSITGGLLYRWNDALIPVIQLQLSKFIIGTSYDVNVSKLTVASQSRGGFELTLSYQRYF